MQTPLRITFRHMNNSAALEARVREHVEHLERLHDRIIGCDVLIGAPAGRHQHGEPFDVRINLNLPEANLHVGSEGSDPTRLDVYAAVNDAFASLERMLKRHNDGRQRQREHDTIRRQPAGTPG